LHHLSSYMPEQYLAAHLPHKDNAITRCHS
jgi:hypothetical protein